MADKSAVTLDDVLGQAVGSYQASAAAPVGTRQNMQLSTQAAADATQANVMAIQQSAEVAKQQAANKQQLAERVVADNLGLAQAVNDLYNGVQQSVSFSRDMAMQRAVEASQATAELERVRAETPSFFSNPVAWFAGKVKAGELADKAEQNRASAIDYTRDAAVVVDHARQKMADLIAQRKLVNTASEQEYAVQLNAGVAQQRAEADKALAISGGLRDAATSAAGLSMRYMEYVQSLDRLAFEKQQAKSLAASRALDDKLKRMQIDNYQLSQDARDQVTQALLVGQPVTKKNVDAARQAAATMQQQDPATFNALMKASALGDGQVTKDHFDAAAVQGMTIGEARLFGKATGNGEAANIGTVYETQLASKIEQDLQARAAEAAGASSVQTWLATTQGAAKQLGAIKTFAQQRASEVVGLMRPADLVNSASNLSRINPSGISTAGLASPQIAAQTYKLPPNSVELKVLTDPRTRVAIDRAQAEGGMSNGAYLGALTMLNALTAAGVKDSYGVVSKVFAQEGAVQASGHKDIAGLKKFGVEPRPSAWLQPTPADSPVNLADPVQLRTFILQNDARRASSAGLQGFVSERVVEALDIAGSKEAYLDLGKAGASTLRSAGQAGQAAGKAVGKAAAPVIDAATSYPDVGSMYPPETVPEAIRAKNRDLLRRMKEQEAARNTPKPLTQQEKLYRAQKLENAQRLVHDILNPDLGRAADMLRQNSLLPPGWEVPPNATQNELEYKAHMATYGILFDSEGKPYFAPGKSGLEITPTGSTVYHTPKVPPLD